MRPPDKGYEYPSFVARAGQLTKVRDLEYFEGPLLSEFKSNNGDIFLFSWCDADDTGHRWLAARTTRPDVAKFLHQQLTLRALIQGCADRFVYLVDADEEGDFVNAYIVAVADLSPKYVPSDASLYDPKLDPSGRRDNDVLIDGDWSMKDLASFPKQWSEAYAFGYVFGETSVRTGGDGAPVVDRDIRRGRGVEAERAYHDLYRMIPELDQPRVQAMQYASPGIISIRSHPKIATEIASAVARFADNKILLSRLNRDIEDATRDGEEVPTVYIRGLVVKFAAVLGGIDVERLLGAASTVHSAADMLRAHYRRLRTLFRFQSDGKAEILK